MINPNYNVQNSIDINTNFAQSKISLHFITFLINQSLRIRQNPSIAWHWPAQCKSLRGHFEPVALKHCSANHSDSYSLWTGSRRPWFGTGCWCDLDGWLCYEKSCDCCRCGGSWLRSWTRKCRHWIVAGSRRRLGLTWIFGAGVSLLVEMLGFYRELSFGRSFCSGREGLVRDVLSERMLAMDLNVVRVLFQILHVLFVF